MHRSLTKRFPRVATLLAICSTAGAADATLPQPPDESLRRAAQLLALDGFKVDATNQATGVLVASRTREGAAGNFACNITRGIPRRYELKVTVVVNAVDAGSTITVSALAEQLYYTRTRVIFIDVRRSHRIAVCKSDGTTEQSLLERLSTP